MRQSSAPAWIAALLLHVGLVLLLVFVRLGPELPPPVTGVQIGRAHV